MVNKVWLILSTTTELVARKTPRVLKSQLNAGEGWYVDYAFFAGAGFTAAAQELAKHHKAELVDLVRLDWDLQQ